MIDNLLKASVIIPIYNTAEYLPRCLESVMNQTLREIEIICVDDGSTDNTLQILDEYASKDERIKIIHKKNGGPTSARKAGVSDARGIYVGFVDSDDWIENDMYERLFQIAEEYTADMVTCGCCLEGNYTTIHQDTVAQGLYEGKRLTELRDKTIYDLEKHLSGLKPSLCNKLFKKEVIQSAQCKIPDEITMGDDKMCLLTVMLGCNSVYVYHKAFYHYRIRANSIVHTGSEEYLLKVYAVYKYLKGLYSNELFTKNMRKQSEIYIIELLHKGINILLGFENKNLLWVDPYWLDKIPQNAKIVLYGAGELGEKYKKQLQSRKDIQYITCIDFAYEKLSSSTFSVEAPDTVRNSDYDYVVITIKNAGKAKTVRKELEDIGIPGERILWFEQAEFFWKFAQAEGLLSDDEEIKKQGDV